MVFTLPGLIFNIIGVLALMRSEWLQKQEQDRNHPSDRQHEHSKDHSAAWSLELDPDAAFSVWMLGGLALVFGFCLHIAALFA